MVGIIPKTTKKAPEWYNLAFYISLGLLIAVILGYALLLYFESKALVVSQDLENQIAQVGTKEEKNMEAQVLVAKKRINDFTELLQAHKKPSNFFAFLEKVCHPQTWFTEVVLNPEKAEASVSGRTVNFQVLDQQLFILREQDLITKVELTKLLISKEGETEFSLYLYLNPQVFQ